MSVDRPPLRVKICGLTRPDDARAAARAGADVVGAVLVDSSPRVVTPERAREIGDAAGRPLALVVANLPLGGLVEAAGRSRAAVLQLHGDETPEFLRRLAEEGAWELWKVARVRSLQEIQSAVDRYHGVARAILLDGWHPAQLGGTGTPFPWDALEALRDRVPRELLVGVAGGLNPGNVAAAVARLRPDIVDVSSGVERSPGVKDIRIVEAFVARARKAGDPAAADGDRDRRAARGPDPRHAPHREDATENR